MSVEEATLYGKTSGFQTWFACNNSPGQTYTSRSSKAQNTTDLFLSKALLHVGHFKVHMNLISVFHQHEEPLSAQVLQPSAFV